MRQQARWWTSRGGVGGSSVRGESSLKIRAGHSPLYRHSSTSVYGISPTTSAVSHRLRENFFNIYFTLCAFYYNYRPAVTGYFIASGRLLGLLMALESLKVDLHLGIYFHYFTNNQKALRECIFPSSEFFYSFYIELGGRWCPVKTQSLSRAIFEITGLKDIEITTLTFEGHVTSSMTSSFDPP